MSTCRAFAPPLLAACLGLGLPAGAGTGLLTPLDGAGPTLSAPWHVVGLPHQRKPLSRFEVVDLEGQRVVKVSADDAYGNLVHPLPAGSRARMLTWRWRVDRPVDDADLQTRDGDDSAIRVCANFDLPLNAVPFIERQLLRLARARSQMTLPAATVCYVWDAHLPAEATIDNAYTRRLRTIVLRGKGSALRTWTSERRDIVADFQRLFGDEAKSLPPLMAVTVAADTDNTRGRSVAYVSDLVLE